jgi:hypothetical protein
MSFYDLAESERIALTEKARADKRTLIERWAALESDEAEPWSKRAALAAEFLQFADAVADLGCGTMALERCLRDGTRYVPIDVCRRDDRTIVCDLNVDPVPATGVEAAACLGLLEYLYAVPSFMREVRGLYPACVASYCVTDAPEPLLPRKSHAWVNDYDRASLTGTFESAGWRVERCEAVDKAQMIWLLKRA